MRELLREEITAVSGGMIGKNEAAGSAIAGHFGGGIGKAVDNVLKFFKHIGKNGFEGIFSKPQIDTYK